MSIILEPPQSVTIIQNKTHFEHGREIRVEDGKVEILACQSYGSYPAAELKWFLGEEELKASDHKNVTEIPNTPTWISMIKLVRNFTTNDMGKNLTCNAYHSAYASHEKNVSVSINVLCK